MKKARLKKAGLMLTAVSGICYLSVLNAATVYASTDYAKNASKWLTDQIFWIGVAATCIGLVLSILKRSYVAAVTTLLGGGIILYFIKNPDKIETIGTALSNIVFK